MLVKVGNLVELPHGNLCRELEIHRDFHKDMIVNAGPGIFQTGRHIKYSKHVSYMVNKHQYVKITVTVFY